MRIRRRAEDEASDGRLLGRVRAGDDAAYDALYQRHEPAVRRLARVLVPSADINDVVAGAFDHVLEVTRDGGGPTEAFRPYVLTALRRVCYERLRAQTARDGDGAQPLDPEPFTDPAIADKSLIARAFRALPERWIAVLWHTQVEEESPAAVAPILGLNPKGVTEVEERALDGLSEVYLRLRFAEAEVTWPGCKQVARRLVAFRHDAASRRDRAMVTEHLSHCNNCGALYEGLAELNTALPGLIAPVYLGGAAGSYLSGAARPAERAAAAPTAASTAATGDTAAHGAATSHDAAADSHAGEAASDTRADDAAADSRAHVVRRSRRTFLSPGLIAAGVAVLAVAGLVLGLALSGGGTPSTPAGRHSQPQAAAPHAPARIAPSQPGQKKKPAARPATAPAISPSPAAADPSLAPGPANRTVRLSATVTVNSAVLVFQQVAFSVTNAGGAATGGLTASLSFPPGTLLSDVSTDDSNGWTCQPAAIGAMCQHAALPAGGRAQDAISLSALGSATCSQPIRLTVVSDGTRAVTQYPQTAQC